MAVQIIKATLAQQVNDGMKLKPLAEHYGIPVSQMKKALQQCGLTIRKFHAPKFELVDDNQQDPGDEQVDVNDSVSEVNHEAEQEIVESNATPVATQTW